MSRLILFNTPWGILTQGTDSNGRPTLRDYIQAPGIHAAGRLDGTAWPDQNNCRGRRRAWMEQPL
jgi:16S rRNA U516 pseudouridylate synthase RsuA-like enzyme